MLLPIAVVAAILIAVFLYLRRNKSSSANKSAEPTVDKKNEKATQAAIQLQDPANSQGQVKNSKKKKKKAVETVSTSVKVKTAKELEQSYGQHYYGCLSLRSSKTLSSITCLTIKNSKVLVGKSNNELVLYDLKKWKMHSTCQDHFFTTLDNNTATAVAISQNYYFAALDFEKTIIYFEFKGGEGGVYFREVKKFPRNIFKGNQGSLYVPEGEKFIVSTGVEADTSINVWSMRGQKLANISSYQIEHYDVKYGGNYALIRGWTSEVKSFQFVMDKDGNFVRLDKSFHLTLSQKPMASTIDNLGLHAIAITGDGEQVKYWELTSHISSHPTETTVESCQIGIDNPKYCSLATVKSENQRLRTILIVASANKLVVLDRACKVISEVEGLDIEQLYSFGASKSAVFGTYSNGKLTVWDFTKLALEQPEYVHPM